MDSRILWAFRHVCYKPFFGSLKGVGYLGAPSFAKGLRRVHVGKHFGLFPGWRIEVLDGLARIGDNVRIGNNFFLNCGSELSIGDEVTISANVFVGTTHHRVDPRLGTHFKDWAAEERPVHVGPGCFLGYGAVLLPGTRLGEGCVVGANAVVQGHYPHGSVIASPRAEVLRTRIPQLDQQVRGA